MTWTFRAPEWWRKWRAGNTYFWLPCPICGEFFAGYEKSSGGLLVAHGLSQMTCPKKECGEEAEKRNEKAEFSRYFRA